MNAVINSNDIYRPLAKQLIKKKLRSMLPDWSAVNEYVQHCRQYYRDTGLIIIDFEKVNKLINRASKNFQEQVSGEYKNNVKIMTQWLERQHTVLNQPTLIDFFLEDTSANFTRCLAPQLSDNLNWIVDHNTIDWSQPLLIRNIVNNEELLSRCIQQQHEYWFVDSGYTNFLHGKQKRWHRLCHNSLHSTPANTYYPRDRLDLLPSIPRPWRKKGSTILVVESSEIYCNLMGFTLEEWRKHILTTLRQYTQRPIEFRSKNSDKKTRQSVFDLLNQTKEYYCVVSHSSSAAIEAVWTGTPIITLGQHVSAPVARNDLSQINDLYRGPIDEWLAALTYHQYTYEEFKNGTALKLSRMYNHV